MSETGPISSANVDVNRQAVELRGQKQLNKAAMEFEALLIAQLLKSTRGNVSKSMFGGGMAEEFFRDSMDQEQAQSIAKVGGFGLSEMIIEEVSRKAAKEGLNVSPVATDTVLKTIKQRQALKTYQP